MNKKTLFFMLIGFYLTLFSAFSKDNEISIISDKLNVDKDERRSTFTGNVYAFDKDLKVWSDKMIIRLKKENDDIKEIIATGSVKIIRLAEGSEIYGNKADYSLENEIIIITGNVIVIENGNQISGNELTVDLNNSSSIMVGSKTDRVEALIIDN